MSSRLGPIVSASDIPDGAVICDVRWYPDGSDAHSAYLAGHIAGAIFVDLDEHLAIEPSAELGRHPMPSPTSFANSMGSLGVAHTDRVVAYDDVDGMRASRLVWMLRIIGVDAALLDGGLSAWTGATSTTNDTRPPVEFPVTEWPDQLFASADDTAAAAAGDDTVVLDARAAERYRGDIEPLDPKAGHIPGALNAPYEANLDTHKLMRPTDVLEQHYSQIGVTPDSDVIVYCGSGVSACHDLLTLEHIGVTDARLYAGSWSQWSNDDTRPVATGD